MNTKLLELLDIVKNILTYHDFYIRIPRKDIKILQILLDNHYLDGEIIKKLSKVVNIDGIFIRDNKLCIEIEEKWNDEE